MVHWTFEFEGDEITGWVEYGGPHQELENYGIKDPYGDLDDAARKRAEEELASLYLSGGIPLPPARRGFHDEDFQDYEERDGRIRGHGPDYWRDPESGEWRCG